MAGLGGWNCGDNKSRIGNVRAIRFSYIKINLCVYVLLHIKISLYPKMIQQTREIPYDCH